MAEQNGQLTPEETKTLIDGLLADGIIESEAEGLALLAEGDEQPDDNLTEDENRSLITGLVADGIAQDEAEATSLLIDDPKAGPTRGERFVTGVTKFPTVVPRIASGFVKSVADENVRDIVGKTAVDVARLMPFSSSFGAPAFSAPVPSKLTQDVGVNVLASQLEPQGIILEQNQEGGLNIRLDIDRAFDIWQEEPERLLENVALLLTGGPGAALKVATLPIRLRRILQVAQAMGRALDPIEATSTLAKRTIPLGAKATGRLAKESYIAGVSVLTSKPPALWRKALESTVGSRSDDFVSALRGDTSLENLLTVASDASTEMVREKGRNYSAAFDALVESKGFSDREFVDEFRGVRDALSTKLRDFRVMRINGKIANSQKDGIRYYVPTEMVQKARIGERVGPVVFGTAVPADAQHLPAPPGFELVDSFMFSVPDPKSRDAIQTLTDFVDQYGTVDGQLTGQGLDNLKQTLDLLYVEGRGGNIVSAVRKKVFDILDKGFPGEDGYAAMTRGYREATDLLYDIEKSLSLQGNTEATLKKIEGAMREVSGYRQQLLDELSKRAGTDVAGSVAGVNLKEWLPAGIPSSFTILGGVAIDPKMLMLLPLSSPRLQAEVLNGIGFSKGQVERVINAMETDPIAIQIQKHLRDIEKRQAAYVLGRPLAETARDLGIAIEAEEKPKERIRDRLLPRQRQQLQNQR